MDIVVRNFFRLLRAGAFGATEQVEPMSSWKWDRLYQIAVMHGVAGLVADGIELCSDDFFLQLSDSAQSKWKRTTERIEQENELMNNCVAEIFGKMNAERFRPILLKGQAMAALYPRPNHRTPGNIDIFFPYEPQAVKADEWAAENGERDEDEEDDKGTYLWKKMEVEHHRAVATLTNKRLNRVLQDIVEEELRAADSSHIIIGETKVEVLPPTLGLLLILLRIMRYTLNEGASLKQIADLGIFLRRQRRRIDFVKLEEWLASLGMQRMAQLEGSLLVRLFGFQVEEIPFMNGEAADEVDRVIGDLFTIRRNHGDEWYFTQGKNIFVKTNNSSAMMWHVKHSIRYFKYYPSEAATNFFISFSRSLSHIEE